MRCSSLEAHSSCNLRHTFASNQRSVPPSFQQMRLREDQAINGKRYVWLITQAAELTFTRLAGKKKAQIQLGHIKRNIVAEKGKGLCSL